MKKLLSLLLTLVLVFSLTACAKKVEAPADTLWKDAVYSSDTTLGSGSTTLTVEVKAEDKSVTFTIKTDAATVGDALMENNLIAGDPSDYGLFIKVVNGMTADYDVDQHYWAFYVNGEYAMTAVEQTEIKEGTAYRLEYAK